MTDEATVSSIGGFGEPEGLGKRLATWANQLGRDRRYPWVGLGLIADLECAARQLGADPAKMFPAIPTPAAAPVEYDL